LRFKERDASKQGGTWLFDQIKQFDELESGQQSSDTLRIPFTFDEHGAKKQYTAAGCNNSQKEILTTIIKTLHEYIMFKDNPNENKQFTPLRMTIMGEAGTGKSFLINTITSIVRTMFQENDVIHITGPTGKN